MMLMSCVGLNSVHSTSPQEHPQYESVRRYAKRSLDLCKTVNSILEERAELDNYVAKSLAKMSSKLNKVATSCEGSLAELYSKSAEVLQAEADLHRWLSETIITDICTPCKELQEKHSRAKKQAETNVEKHLKSFLEKRNDEFKGRKSAFSLTKDCEDIREHLKSKVDSKGKSLTDKDIKKLEKKLCTTREERDRHDLTYWNECQKVELARQDWELSITKAICQMRESEEERIRKMSEYITKFSEHLSKLGPKCSKNSEVLEKAVKRADVDTDLRSVEELYKSNGEQQSQPLLPMFYAETLDNRMDPVERRRLLIKYLTYAQSDLSREVKGREGVEKLVSVYRTSPNFGDIEVQQEVNDKLQQVKKMIEYMEASQFKISAALFLLDITPESGRSVSIKRSTSTADQRVPVATLSPADDNRQDYDESDYRDSFYSFQTEDASKAEVSFLEKVIDQASNSTNDSSESTANTVDDIEAGERLPPVLCHSRVLYDFTARHDDELSLSTGDIIRVYCKQTADWWFGEKVSDRGDSGLFPSVYVEELSPGMIGMSSYV